MTATIVSPTPTLEAAAAYFWSMAHGMNTARRSGNGALASEYAEALELVSCMDDRAVIWVAAHRALASRPTGTPAVVLQFPSVSGPNCGRQREARCKRKMRRRPA